LSDLLTLTQFPNNVQIKEMGLLFSGEMPEEDWRVAVAVAGAVRKSFTWGLGDALNYGESRYGESYAQMMEETGLAYQTLANIKSLAAAIPIEIRHPGLSEGHHRVVAKFRGNTELQAKWLQVAYDNGLTTDEFRAIVNSGSKPEDDIPALIIDKEEPEEYKQEDSYKPQDRWRDVKENILYAIRALDDGNTTGVRAALEGILDMIQCD
jgi:hypothetical protein